MAKGKGAFEVKKVDPKTPLKKRIEIFEDYFYRFLIVDPIDVTPFDCDHIDFFKKMREKYGNQ